MADQIEMSTVENSTGNSFSPFTNFLGRPNIRTTGQARLIQSHSSQRFCFKLQVRNG